ASYGHVIESRHKRKAAALALPLSLRCWLSDRRLTVMAAVETAAEVIVVEAASAEAKANAESWPDEDRRRVIGRRVVVIVNHGRRSRLIGIAIAVGVVIARRATRIALSRSGGRAHAKGDRARACDTQHCR